jgi:DNA uptake protein ComE-like DNA-binding protein
MNVRSTSLPRAAVIALLASTLVACGAAPAAPAAQSAAATAAPAVQSAAATAAPAVQSAAATAAPAVQSAAKLNLNSLTEAELTAAIPNFPSRMVREFFEYRPYISIQQFRKEIGKYVGADVVATYEQYVYVPITVDQSDAATLQQIPGVDAATADRLIAARPYGSNQSFLSKLAELAPSVDPAQATALLAQ